MMDERYDKILRLLKEGKRAAEVAREVQCSRQNVHQVIRQSGFVYAYAREPSKRLSRVCENPNCNKRFSGLASDMKDRRFCSNRCHQQSRGVKTETRPCSNCNDPITRLPAFFRTERVFCNHSCRNLYYWKLRKAGKQPEDNPTREGEAVVDQ